MSEPLLLVLFNIFIVVMLALDLGVFQRKAHFPSMAEAVGWSAAWILLAVLFGGYIWLARSPGEALAFYTGYVVEEALSVDNVFVFIIILTYFAVPRHLQRKVLSWGVVSAILLRAIFIVVGATLVAKFHWILYLLGAFLVVTAVKLAVQKDIEVKPDKNPLIRFARKLFPVTESYEGGRFFVRRHGKATMTPLFLVLLMIETTDIAFATDSIPAIFAITQDTFIIYTSNIFAILGLRSLYFVVSGFMNQFRFLKYGLSVVLAFIGAKMLVEPWVAVSLAASLSVIFSLIAISIAASMLIPKKSTM